MYLARKGGRERERELSMECNGGYVREILLLREWGKGVCVFERIRDRNMERKNERVSETNSSIRWLRVED
jgi:hypothetical protein